MSHSNENNRARAQQNSSGCLLGEKRLSEREVEILSLFAEGYTAKTASEKLHLSTGTIRTHRQNILQKSNCKNITEAVAKCIRKGII